MDENLCVSCGAVIPEGQQVCPKCAMASKRAKLKTDNRSNGNRFERWMEQILWYNGFWPHVLQQNKSGQPADIIAVKGRYHTLIDCKVISNDRGFPFTRVEENQRLAMQRFEACCGESGWFALQLPDESLWMVSYARLHKLMLAGIEKLSEEEIRKTTWPLNRWLMATDDWSKDV